MGGFGTWALPEYSEVRVTARVHTMGTSDLEPVVENIMGAADTVMGSNYNSKPLAGEILIDKGVPHIVRQRQSFEDMIRGEVIPR